MTARENIIKALNGEFVDKTPYTFYSWIVTQHKQENINKLFADDWRRLYELGLGICHHVNTVKQIQHGVKDDIKIKKVNNDIIKIHTKHTPVGKIQQVHKNKWHQEYFIKSPSDYKIMKWIIENTEFVTDYQAFEHAEQLIGDNGISVITSSRTPAMSINIDWAGTERFCLDLALELPEFLDLYDAQKKLFLKEAELIANGPGRFVKIFENLTISMLGPKNYQKFLMPVYNDAVPIYEKNDKRVMVHYDGALSCIKDQIAKAPFHIIESLTEAPEGDMDYAQCRANWPDKVFWANINVGLYSKPPDMLQQDIIKKLSRAGRKGFLFEISESMPDNYKETIPIVLEAIEKQSCRV